MKTLAHCIGVALCAVLVHGSSTAEAHGNLPTVYSVENTGAHFPAPVFPTFDQLPIIRPLPDPFVFFDDGRRGDDGRRDTSFESWERRRNEIKAAIEKYEIGPKPDCSDCTITASYTPPAAGSNTGSLQVVVTRKGKSLTLTSRVYIPSGASGAVPVLIPMSLAFPPFFVPPIPNYGSLPADAFAGLPVATVDFFHNDVTALSFFGSADHSQDPFYQLYPELCAGICTGTSNSGQYAAWSWGVSRLIDGLAIATRQKVNPLPVDMKHVAVTGCSYAGKMALFAGALDERVALTIAQENGGGGAPSWRVSHQIEADLSVEDIHDTNYDWFAGQMLQFANDASYKLPTDHHELMAMVAPRALLETGNTDFYWLSNQSNYISARATQRVYDTFGIDDRFGFYIDGGHPHCGTLPAESPVVASYVKRFMLGDSTANTDVKVNPYPVLDFGRWTAWWGGDRDHDFGPPHEDHQPWHDGFGEAVHPGFPNDWNSNGTVVMSLHHDLRALINSGDTVLGAYQLAVAGHAHPDATVSLVSGNVQADIRCFDGTSYTLTIPFATNQSYSIPAGLTSFVPDPWTPQGSATASHCTGFLEGAYFTALGINPGPGVGNPGGPGFTTTDTTDALVTRFNVSANGVTTQPSKPLVVNFKP
jgi:hypothetical protein